MSLFKMTMRRVKTVLAWLLAMAMLALIGFGIYYIAEVM